MIFCELINYCSIESSIFFSDNLLHDGGVSGPVSLPASRLTSATTSGPTGNSRKDLTSGSGGPGGGATSPPPPPPRGSNPPPTSGSSYTRSHARSSSLDLNNLQNRELHHKNNSSQILHQRPPTVCLIIILANSPKKYLKFIFSGYTLKRTCFDFNLLHIFKFLASSQTYEMISLLCIK
jgi:hypothetical protein